METRIRHDGPARDWAEGYPIGNGRLAAMVLGAVKRERLALNHEWLWKGHGRRRDVWDAADRLPEVRKLILAGDTNAGTRLANAVFGSGRERGDGTSCRVDPFQTAGDLYLDLVHGAHSHYRRELDLESGIARTVFLTRPNRNQQGHVVREAMVHLTHNLLLLHVAVEEGIPVTGAVSLDRLFSPDCDLQREIKGDQVVLRGRIRDGGVAFVVRARVFTDGGALCAEGNTRLGFIEARSALVALNMGVDVFDRDPEAEAFVPDLDAAAWNALRDEHVAAHRKALATVTLSLGLPAPDAPTDRRLERVRAGESDPALAGLYFNYGRYLFHASSARGEVPATLQGKWCDELHPAWDSDMHHDINLEMNYWLAEPCAMPDATDALFRHVERCVPHGREAARRLYGCRGIYLPIQTDPWGRCTPESQKWAVWIGAAAWLAQHFWTHYEYSLDETFLRDRAYPIFKEVAAFYEDYLIEDEQGRLQIVPSQSPENAFAGTDPDLPVSICVSSTSDVMLAWDALTRAIDAAEILNVDSDKREQWRRMRDALPPLRIGGDGRLLEWNHEVGEREPGHRHISHLIGFFPGDQITRDGTPELFEAARKSLDARAAAQDSNAPGGDTGWCLAWYACCYAHYGDGDRALEILTRLFTKYTTASLLDLHPPRIFQIDGNLGGAMAVVEMLLQSQQEVLRLLPALPAAWPAGRVTGLRARGGYTVDITWDAGRLVTATIHAACDRSCRIRDPGHALGVTAADGAPVRSQHAGHCLLFEARAGTRYSVA
ncbi:MAG: glycoside hydrolase N-terminal domain-containing protein [Lentisphaerae bacterium]|nr:glycoside hydrolase N-terminal domain-containing protein [Lentisphaerota bacterium]